MSMFVVKSIDIQINGLQYGYINLNVYFELSRGLLGNISKIKHMYR